MENLFKRYLSHREFYKVAVDEVDFSERLKPSAIMQYFQDLATIHADEIGIGFQTMLEKNLIWVLSRMSVKIKQYPSLGERICVMTFPRKPNSADALRDYYITDESGGNLYISGSSKWCVIDVNNHMIRRCAPLFSYSDDMYIPTAPFDDANPVLDELSSGKCIMTDRVHITDLDRNRHMNNARYGDIMFNACDIEWIKEHEVESFDVNFLSELKYGDEYAVYVANSQAATDIQTLRGSDAVFRAHLEWRKK